MKSSIDQKKIHTQHMQSATVICVLFTVFFTCFMLLTSCATIKHNVNNNYNRKTGKPTTEKVKYDVDNKVKN